MMRTGESPRICFIVDEYDADTDTHYRHLYKLMGALAEKRDVQVHMVAEKARPSTAACLPIGISTQRHRWPPFRLLEEIAIISGLRLRGYRSFYVHYAKYGAITASLVVRLMGGRVYYWNCGEVLKFFLPWKCSFQRISHKVRSEWALRLAIAMSDRLVTGNHAMADYYAKGFNLPLSRIAVFPNFVDLAEFGTYNASAEEARETLGLPQDRNIVLFVHRLSERKGAHHIPSLVRSVTVCCPNDPPLFVIVGDGPYREPLRHALTSAGLLEYTVLAGSVPNSRINLYYRAADLFVMPSEEEGFPRVLIEAMACGLPLIATDVGGTRELLRGSQLECVVPRGDMAAFSELIVEVLRDPERRRLLAEEGKRVVQEYSLDKVIDTFIHMVKDDD